LERENKSDEAFITAKDLIKHLLCVDPGQRFSIDEFLVHGWCTASPAPPPPPTPNIYNIPAYPIDSPLLSELRGRREARSPGLANMKEAFDITYAVHRMEEESARRRKYGAGPRRSLAGLNEDDEDEEEGEGEEEEREKIATNAPTQGLVGEGGRAGQRDQGHGQWVRAAVPGHGHAKGFELDLHGATLLGRRHKQGGVRSPLGAEIPLSMATGGMRIDDGPIVGIR
jgi:hypothetical protein